MSRIRISDAYKSQKNEMRLLGVWHEESPTTFYKIRRALSWTPFLIAYAGMLSQVFHVVADMEKLVQILCITTSYSSYFCKILGFLCKRETFLKMLDDLEDPMFTPRSELGAYVVDAIRITAAITKVYWFVCASVVVMFWVYPILENTSLITPLPFDMGKYTILMYFMQSIAIAVAALNNLNLDTLCASLMALACSQFDILRHKIMDVRQIALLKVPNSMRGAEVEEGINPDVDEVVTVMLKNCVRHHCAIITFVENIESVFSFGLLTQFLGSIIVICNTGFYLIMISSVSLQFTSMVAYFVAMMTQLSLYCWYGNEIMLKSVKLGEACYISNWYTCGLKARKLVFIMMERSKRPLSITAWKFANLSLSSFSSIIQWSYSYFALLQRLSQNKELT